MACIVYELLTGRLLFSPEAGSRYSKTEDHLSLMEFILGKMPRKVGGGGGHVWLDGFLAWLLES